MEILDLEVQKREVVGKAYVKKLRNLGLIPAVVYGRSKEPIILQIEGKEFEKIFKTRSRENSILNLKFMGGTEENITAMIQDLQRDILKPDVLHADFIRISLDEKTRVMVPLNIVGEPTSSGGVLDTPVREVEVECLPLNIPRRIDVDISNLSLNEVITVAELKVAEEIEILANPSDVVVAYNEMEAEPVEGEEEEGEALFAPEKSEPEVIGRKKEEE